VPDLTTEEWRTFLAGTNVAVFGVARDGSGPLLAPVWYEYDPAEGFRFAMSGTSAKVRRLRAVGRATVCVQEDVGEYKYVIAEGPVSIRELTDAETHDLMTSMSIRYMGPEAGRQNADEFDEPHVVLVTLVPDRWRAERV
jgi:PPOX class probable F420-dependent enzyme